MERSNELQSQRHSTKATPKIGAVVLSALVSTATCAANTCQENAEQLRMAFDRALIDARTNVQVTRTVNVEDRREFGCHLIFDMSDGNQIQGIFLEMRDGLRWTADESQPLEYESQVMAQALIVTPPPPPPSVQLAHQQPAKAEAPGLQFETVETDKAWLRDEADGACTRLRDRVTDSDVLIADCHRHQASLPACVDYKEFAKIWFGMRKANDTLLQWQANVLETRGRTDKPYVPLLHSREHTVKLQRLLTFVQAGNLSRWNSSESFEAEAYARCLAGRTF